LEALNALSRQRPLNSLESLRLERAVRRASQRRERWHWSRADDYRLIRHLLRGRKPKQIAIHMRRTEGAIWKRIGRLGLTVEAIEKMTALASAPGSGRRRRKKSPIDSAERS
jgi:hypothetical protein